MFQPVAAAHCSIDDDTPHAWGPVLTQSYEQTTARINFSMMTFKEDNSLTIVTASGMEQTKELKHTENPRNARRVQLMSCATNFQETRAEQVRKQEHEIHIEP